MLGLAALAGTTTLAQRGGFNTYSGSSTGNARYDGKFTFVRMSYPDGGGFRRGGRLPPWSHDWPRGEEHFLKILAELTNVDTRTTESSVMSWSDPEVFKFPVVYMCEPGFWTMSDAEVKNFRAYLQKGGYMVLDDFRRGDWANVEIQVARAFPEGRWVELDVKAPIFHSFYEIDSLDIIPQAYDLGLRPTFIGLYEDNDPTKRLMIVAAYNQDMSEFWEWSDTGYAPLAVTNEAYKIGINLFMYGITH
jgi:hypothetical protein